MPVHPILFALLFPKVESTYPVYFRGFISLWNHRLKPIYQTLFAVIDGQIDGTTQSVIRRRKFGDPVVVNPNENILNQDGSTLIKIEYDRGTLSVSKDDHDIPFLRYTDGEPIDVRYVGFSTGFGSSGEFQVLNLPERPDAQEIQDHEAQAEGETEEEEERTF